VYVVLLTLLDGLAQLSGTRYTLTLYFRMTCLAVMALSIAFLLLLVFHGNAALKEYVAVTKLSPGRLFHLLVLPVGRSRAPKFAPSMPVRAKYNHEESKDEPSYWVTAID